MPHRFTARSLAIAVLAAAIPGCADRGPEAAMQTDYDRKIQWQGITSETCELASIQEISTILGTPVIDSRMMARDSGRCQWLSRSIAGASLRIHGPEQAPAPGNESSHEPLPDLGADAFLVAYDDEYRAHANTANRFVTVTAPDRGSAEAILRLVLTRLQR